MLSRRPALVTLTSLVTATALAACGGSPTASGGGTGQAAEQAAADAAAVFDELNGLTGQERTDRLVELAEAEGSLSIYTSITELQEVEELFEETYDIEVQEYEGNSETVLQRLLQENDANYFGADLVESNATELGVLNDEGLLAEYTSELRNQVPTSGQKENWTADRYNVFVVAWNTELVAEDEVPTSFEELADPRWEGRLSMEVGDVDWYAAMHDYYLQNGKSETEVEEMFQAIAANSTMAKGHSVQAELLAAGEFDIAVSAYSHNIDKAADKGASVAWRTADGGAVEPVIVRPNGIALLKTAQHPAAATLFLDFTLAQEGQTVFEDAFRIPAIPSAGAPDVLADLEVFPVPEQKMLDDGQTWSERYESLTSGAK